MSDRAMAAALTVLHCDNHLLVVAKPAGLPTVPDASGDESLLDRARAWVRHTYDKPGEAFLGVVHRLDRPVSGVLIFARTGKAAGRLSAAFAHRRVSKVYWALTREAPGPPQGRLEQWLRKDRERNRVHVSEPDARGARLAITEWRVLEREADTCLVELVAHTGRPHQLRVAMASLGTPLLGDLKYGARRALPDRSVALHSRSLELAHPTRDVVLRFEAPPPPPDAVPWSLPSCLQARRQGPRVTCL